MRDSTCANTTRAEQGQPLQPTEDARFLERAGDVGPGLIARDGALGGGAQTRLLADPNAGEQTADVLRVAGTALSKGHLSLSHGASGLVGRVLEPGRTAGEPMISEQAWTSVDEVRKGADNTPRAVNLALSGDKAAVGDVAAGESRGVARLAL